MRNVAVTKDVNAPAERVWEVISDYGGVHKFHPMVKTSPILTKNARGLGAKRRCEFYDRTSVVEEITKWDEGKSISVVLSEASMPLKRANATIRISPINGDSSEVTLAMDYDVKYGSMGKLMDMLMMRRMMQKMFFKVLKGLEHHVVTGELIGENGVPVTRAHSDMPVKGKMSVA